MAAAGPPVDDSAGALDTHEAILSAIPHHNMNWRPERAYFGRIDAKANESMIADAHEQAVITRGVYDRLIKIFGFAATKSTKAPRPAHWLNDDTCVHNTEKYITCDCRHRDVDIAIGDWLWGRDGKSALVATARTALGTFPATRSIYAKVVKNTRTANDTMRRYLEQPVRGKYVWAQKRDARNAFIYMHAAEVLCTRFIHEMNVLPIPRLPKELVVIPALKTCAFGYTVVNAEKKIVHIIRCTSLAPAKMLAHGGQHSCARHATSPTGWIEYDETEAEKESRLGTGKTDEQVPQKESARQRIIKDAKNPIYVRNNRLSIAKRRRHRMHLGELRILNRRKTVHAVALSYGLNDARLVDAIIAMSEVAS